MKETMTIDKGILVDLIRLTNEINERVESLELINDSDFMSSLKKAETQVKKRDFADWNAL